MTKPYTAPPSKSRPLVSFQIVHIGHNGPQSVHFRTLHKKLSTIITFFLSYNQIYGEAITLCYWIIRWHSARKYSDLNPKRITTDIKPEKKNEVPMLTILKCETSAPCLKCIPTTTCSKRKIYMRQKKKGNIYYNYLVCNFENTSKHHLNWQSNYTNFP